MSFTEAYEEFKIYASKRHKKQGFDTITNDFNLHILPYFNNCKLSDITKKDIINWQDNILSKNFSNNYNNKLYSTFSSFIKFSIDCGYIDINYLSEIGRFKKKIEKSKYDVYSLNEFRHFRCGIDNFVYKQFFNFMFFCGTRPGEAMALRFSDLNGRIISINHTIHRRGNRELDTPKNQSSYRSFKISYLMFVRIKLLRRYYVKKYGYGKDYFIFGGLKPLSTTTIDRVKHRACIKKNIREITQHQFRHSYATYLIHKGVPIDYVSKTMGHSHNSTTLDIYLHQEKKSNWRYSF